MSSITVRFIDTQQPTITSHCARRCPLLWFLTFDKPETLSDNDVRPLRSATRPRKCQKSPNLPRVRVGVIPLHGPAPPTESCTAGYFHNADATRVLFHDDWLNTGDLSYVADADLYVTGRVKDVIITPSTRVPALLTSGAVTCSDGFGFRAFRCWQARACRGR